MAYSLNETTVTESKWRKYLLGFKSYILMERSHSVNTLNAYLDDCNKFFTFMEREYPNIGPQETELKHLQHFLKKQSWVLFEIKNSVF